MPDNKQEGIEHFSNEIAKLLEGDDSPVLEQICEASPQAAQMYNALPEDQQRLVQVRMMVVDAIMLYSLMSGQPPWEIAGVLAGELVQGEILWETIEMARRAQNN